VARKQLFLNAEFSEQWKESYQALQHAQQQGVDKVVMALLKQQTTPGMRVKPIEPDKYYNEARINDGDRIIHRTHEGTVYFVDIVPHDEIGKYGRAPKRPSGRER
jgi:hypothetical protein